MNLRIRLVYYNFQEVQKQGEEGTYTGVQYEQVPGK